MFTIYLYFTLLFINNLDASTRKSKNESVKYSDFVPRVVNGWPGKLGDVPYQIAFKVLIRRTRIYTTFCGGVITSPTKLLSAAHCFAHDEKNICKKMCGGVVYGLFSLSSSAYSSIAGYGLLVEILPKALGVPSHSGAFHTLASMHHPSRRFFVYNIRRKRSLSPMVAVAGNLRNRGYYGHVDTLEDGQWRKLSRVVYPRTYKFPRDDIAIVWTRKPFNFNSYISAIPIARKRLDYTGKCLVSGFGRTGPKTTSDKLLLAHLDLIPSRRCSRMHRKNMRLFVCTSSAVTDVGKGDSGGPLVCFSTSDPNEVGGKGILVGIVSGHRYHVGSFFTRVSSYYRYIERNKCSSNELDIRLLCLIMTIHKHLLLF